MQISSKVKSAIEVQGPKHELAVDYEHDMAPGSNSHVAIEDSSEHRQENEIDAYITISYPLKRHNYFTTTY